MTKEGLRAVMIGGKNHEVAKAWIDGAKVQHRAHSNDEWRNDPNTEHCGFHSSLEYRIKPKTLRYRVALMTNGLGFATTDYGVTAHVTCANFVRWLGDWQEVEA